MDEPLSNGRFRVMLDLSPDANKRLGEIRKLADAKTNAEAVRNALRLFEWYLQQKKVGSKILSVSVDGVAKELEFIF